MKEYMINDYTEKLETIHKDSLLNIKIIKGESPIAAVREVFKGYGKIRKARREEKAEKHGIEVVE